MKYIRAILATISLSLSPFVMAVLIKWYCNYFKIPLKETDGFWVLYVCVAIGMVIINVILWISALGDKEIKEVIK